MMSGPTRPPRCPRSAGGGGVGAEAGPGRAEFSSWPVWLRPPPAAWDPGGRMKAHRVPAASHPSPGRRTDAAASSRHLPDGLCHSGATFCVAAHRTPLYSRDGFKPPKRAWNPHESVIGGGPDAFYGHFATWKQGAFCCVGFGALGVHGRVARRYVAFVAQCFLRAGNIVGTWSAFSASLLLSDPRMCCSPPGRRSRRPAAAPVTPHVQQRTGSATSGLRRTFQRPTKVTIWILTYVSRCSHKMCQVKTFLSIFRFQIYTGVCLYIINNVIIT